MRLFGAARRGFDGRKCTRAALVRKYLITGTIRPMRVAGIVIGILLIAAGLVWIAQGLDLAFAPQSFMTADRTWIVIGAATALVGVIVAGLARRRTG